MTRIPFHARALLGMCLAMPAVLLLTPQAQAAWSDGGTGPATSLAYTMPTGGQPTAAASGTSVSLRWPAALFPDGRSVAGYVIRRFDAVNGSEAMVGASCSATVTITTCTELNVPAGTWIYTDSPVQDNWTGGPSAPSAPVTTS